MPIAAARLHIPSRIFHGQRTRNISSRHTRSARLTILVLRRRNTSRADARLTACIRPRIEHSFGHEAPNPDKVPAHGPSDEASKSRQNQPPRSATTRPNISCQMPGSSPLLWPARRTRGWPGRHRLRLRLRAPGIGQRWRPQIPVRLNRPHPSSCPPAPDLQRNLLIRSRKA